MCANHEGRSDQVFGECNQANLCPPLHKRFDARCEGCKRPTRRSVLSNGWVLLQYVLQFPLRRAMQVAQAHPRALQLCQLRLGVAGARFKACQRQFTSSKFSLTLKN